MISRNEIDPNSPVERFGIREGDTYSIPVQDLEPEHITRLVAQIAFGMNATIKYTAEDGGIAAFSSPEFKDLPLEELRLLIDTRVFELSLGSNARLTIKGKRDLTAGH